MEDYSRIIESLAVKFSRLNNVTILHPVTVKNQLDENNLLVYVEKGKALLNEQIEIGEGSSIFVPAGVGGTITYNAGLDDIASELHNEEFLVKHAKFMAQHKEDSNNSFFLLYFDAKIFDSVSFFSSLEISPFVLKDNLVIGEFIYKILAESKLTEAGTSRAITNYTDLISIEIIRYLIKNQMFVEQLVTNSTYFKDPRLIKIFSFIKENLSGDLSNKVLAKQAQVSEDYVGQYFKMLTGINPQDYIEYQRMEEAVELLRHSKESIKEVGIMVGYKDTAYFCRRFKMMFGIPAAKLRRREKEAQKKAKEAAEAAEAAALAAANS